MNLIRLSRATVLVGIAAIVGVIAVFAAPALARVSHRSSIPSAVGVDASSAQRAAVVSLKNGQRASVWTARMTDGRRCALLQVDSSGNAAPAFSGSGGGTCGASAAPPAAHPILVRISGDGASTIVSGQAAASIAKLVLQTADGTSTLPLARGLFVGELASLPNGSTPYTIIGYSHSGAEIGRVDLNEVIASATAPQ